LAHWNLTEYKLEDAWGMWQDRWPPNPPEPPSSFDERILALDHGGLLPCEGRRAASAWLTALSRLSGGQFLPRSIREVWTGHETRQVEVSFWSNGHNLAFTTAGMPDALAAGPVVSAANAALDRVGFKVVEIETDDFIMWVDSARELALRKIALSIFDRSDDTVASRERGEPPPEIAPVEPPTPELPRLSDIDPEKLEALRTRLAHHERTCWIPITEEGERADEPNKFGGSPWFLPRKRAPTCFRCKNTMALGLQLVLSGLPEPIRASFRPPPRDARFIQSLGWLQETFPRRYQYDLRALRLDPVGRGVLQYFLCTGDDCLCDQEPTSGYRFLPSADCRMRSAKNELPPRTIVGWREARDLPHPADWGGLDLGFGPLDRALLAELVDPPYEGDKIGGWPCWEQGRFSPQTCGCDPGPEFLVQTASEDNLPVGYGDDGRQYAFFCPAHPDDTRHTVQYG